MQSTIVRADLRAPTKDKRWRFFFFRFFFRPLSEVNYCLSRARREFRDNLDRSKLVAYLLRVSVYIYFFFFGTEWINEYLIHVSASYIISRRERKPAILIFQKLLYRGEFYSYIGLPHWEIIREGGMFL